MDAMSCRIRGQKGDIGIGVVVVSGYWPTIVVKVKKTGACRCYGKWATSRGSVGGHVHIGLRRQNTVGQEAYTGYGKYQIDVALFHWMIIKFS